MKSVPQVRKPRTPEERLAELKDRYAHELMDTEERCELEHRIRKLRKEVDLDAHYSCLSRIED